MGLKITVHVCSWGKLWGNRYEKTKKKKKSWLRLLKSQEQKLGVGSKSRVLHVPPALGTTNGVASHLSHPCGPTPGHTPTLTPYKEQVHHPPPLPWGLAQRARETVFSQFPYCSRRPNKALPGGEKKRDRSEEHRYRQLCLRQRLCPTYLISENVISPLSTLMELNRTTTENLITVFDVGMRVQIFQIKAAGGISLRSEAGEELCLPWDRACSGLRYIWSSYILYVSWAS